ncbi:hypothetical protein G6F37_001729 [Rhizopus arrhizus]|nr:hypothetical protein G6F38_000782 [Rhizopus arrhizus]KAG1162891.1 hypothetical protein G6F37_001729 [Rhizopus arrhizus]
MPSLPPFLNFRAGVAIGSKFYMPFMSDTPFCYIFDLVTEQWSSKDLTPINTVNETYPEVTSAAAIGRKIYLVGGRLLKSYTLSNSLIEIDTETFTVQAITDAVGTPPRARHEHSVDAVANRYLVIFGGLCYNSVDMDLGENDVYVYDTLKKNWFVPHVSGQFPHLRFGHASAVIGKDLYIHGGAQIDSDSSYIIYDDLYRLDCQEWVWYKYEHPEVERYLRGQPQVDAVQKNFLIPTTGDSPHDRFQSYMCAASNKLITFGGHSIRIDEEDNEISCNYPLDELSIFNTKRHSWATINARVPKKEDEDFMTVSDMCVAVVPIDSRSVKIFIFANSSSSHYASGDIIENYLDDSRNFSVDRHCKILKLPEGEFRKPDDSKHSEHVKEPQLDRQSSSKEVKGTTSIKSLHKDDNVDSNTNNMQGETNASSISYRDSGSSEGYTTAKVRRQNRITPCIIVIDLLE